MRVRNTDPNPSQRPVGSRSSPIFIAPRDFASQFAFGQVDPERADRIRDTRGLDQPRFVRSFFWLRNVVSGLDFGIAAKALGAGEWSILVRHLPPQAFSFIIATLSLIIPSVILTEAALSFYGLGIQPPATQLGGSC